MFSIRKSNYRLLLPALLFFMFGVALNSHAQEKAGTSRGSLGGIYFNPQCSFESVCALRPAQGRNEWILLKPEACCFYKDVMTSQESEKKEAETELEEGYFPEIEFIASNKFRSLGYLQPMLKKGLNFETHYFGIEGTDVGVVSGSWTFRAGKHVKLTPGLGVYFGERQTTAPALTFRWEIEKGPIFSQGLFIQSLRKNKPLEKEEEILEGVYPNIWDGNHVSYRYKRWDIGPLWERIHGREGNEWKGGVRTAFRFWKYVSGLLVIVGPDTEVRGGFIIHPPRL